LSKDRSEVDNAWVNQVLSVARSLSADAEAQITMLAAALVIVCDSHGVGRQMAVSVMAEIAEAPMELVSVN